MASRSELARSLRWSTTDGCAHAFMLGSGEAYLIPFAVFLGAGALTVGLISSLPLFLGAVAQLVSVHVLDRFGRRRFQTVVYSGAQAIMWIPIFLLPLLFPQWGPLLLLGGVTLYTVLGNLIAPVWSSWMGDLVPGRIRGRYFGSRNRILSLFTCAGLAGGALILETGNGVISVWTAFGVVFGLALIARVLSAYSHTRVKDMPYTPPAAEDRFTLLQFLHRSGRSNFAKFVFFVTGVHAVTWIAAPFFALYMLRDLNFSYLEFLGASAAGVLAQFLTLHTWGLLSDRIGNRRILEFTGLGISLVPLLWLTSTNFGWILVFQVVSGVVWGGFNLSTTNFIFDAVSPAKRSRCFAYFNLLVQGGVLLGTLAGGLLAPSLGSRIVLSGMSLEFAYPLQMLFLVSGTARFAIMLVLLPIFQEVRPVHPLPYWDLLFNVIGIRPIRGLQFGIHIPLPKRRVADRTPQAIQSSSAGRRAEK